MIRILRIWSLSLLLACAAARGQNVDSYQAPGAGNPLLPGYFADPTVKKFGDTYYIYATTDGNGGGFGPSQVWTSKDFVNWTMQPMNWPTTLHYWAPDVTQGNDGNYYLYYCQPTVEVYGATSQTPTGPWTPLFADGRAVVKNHLVPNVITLDGQTFRDDDGKFYMFWGTWGIYSNSGCGIGQLNDDMKTFSKTAKLPNSIAKDFFEAPFMFKRNGIYYLTYSSGRCEDGTYRVQYVTSKTGPMGPFDYSKTNPILVTSADGRVHGPGHQSVIEHQGDYYLIYHRHNNPHNNGGYHRQICADKLVFDAQGNIEKVVPTHKGIGPLGPLTERSPNRAFTKKVTASSAYSADFRPSFAVDDNNGTLWKPRDNTGAAWLQIDLGTEQPIRRIHTQFEYATWYYQYLWEYSIDGHRWMVFADQRKNTRAGSPMVDRSSARARYIRLTITDTQYPGLNKAVWNVKVYSTDRQIIQPGQQPAAVAHQPAKPKGLLLDLRTDSLPVGRVVNRWPNAGNLGGTIDVASARSPRVDLVAGRKALVFSGKECFKSTVSGLPTLAGNRSWTVSMWVYNPTISDEEPILSWTPRGGREISNASVGYGSNRNWGAVAHWGWPDLPYATVPKAAEWHHIAVVFDGTMECIYVDGTLDREDRRMLFLRADNPLLIGTNADQNAFFSGAISSLKLYDIALSPSEIQTQAMQKNNFPIRVSLNAAKLPYGQSLSTIPNEGAAGGQFRFRKPVSVQSVAGKLAVVIPEGNQLAISATEFRPSPSVAESTVMVHYDSAGRAWHHTVSVRRDDTWVTYRDGKRERPTPAHEQAPALPDRTSTHHIMAQTQLVLPETGHHTDTKSAGSTAIFSLENFTLAEYQIFNLPLSEADVKALFADWRTTMQSVPRPAFERKPAATTPTRVDMAVAAPAGQALQYRFDETTGNFSSGWLDEPTFTHDNLRPDQRYQYTVTVRDAFGNVSPPSEPVSVETATSQFSISRSAFDPPTDFLKSGTAGSIWEGLVGNHPNETAVQISSQAGRLRLESANSNWDGSTPKGPFLYKQVTGDFVAQVEVVDVSGQSEQKAQGANDVGLMVRLPQSTDETSERLIQNSIFPGWGVGNLVTDLSEHGRQQFNNQSAWHFNRYLQIQRQDDVFHLRSSQDGLHWTALPGSPIERPDWHQKAVQVGLFQATYGPDQGYGAFQNYQLITPRK